MNVRKKKKTCRAYKHVVSVLCGAAIQCEPSVMNGYDKDGRSQDLRTVPTVTELHGKFNFGGRTAQNDHKRHRHSKETMEFFVPHVNRLVQHLPVRKLTGYLLEYAQNQGSMGQNEGLRER